MIRHVIYFLKHQLKAAAPLTAAFFCVSTAWADPVTVTSQGGGVVLSGEVVGYDGVFLQLATQHGPMTIRYATVTCEGADCPDHDGFLPLVRLSGAARMADVVMPALVESFGRSNGWQSSITRIDPVHFEIMLIDQAGNGRAKFSFRGTNTDEGFADLIAFEADIAMAIREISHTEAALAADAGLGDLIAPQQSRIIGLDALVPVVHPALSIDAISLNDMARAFRGAFDNWSDIGGPDLPVHLHLGPVGSGQMQFFINRVVRADDGVLTANVIRHPDMAALRDAVATMPGSIGVLSYRQTGNTQPLALRDSCGFTSTPVLTSLKTEDYPLTEPLFLYLPDRIQPQVLRDFLAWLRGPEAQLVVRRARFVDQGAVPISLDAQGQRFVNAIAKAGEDTSLTELQRMVTVLMPRTRMSTSFRFEVGSTRLDAQSRSNLMALGQAIKGGRYDGQSLMLVGFSDGRGGAGPNRDLSRARADSVRRALISALGGLPDNVTIETEAFGEALPMGCDDTEWGQQMNRRVELWVDQRKP